jgi:hypothetical protein
LHVSEETGIKTGIASRDKRLSMGEVGSFDDEWEVQRFFYSYRKKKCGDLGEFLTNYPL